MCFFFDFTFLGLLWHDLKLLETVVCVGIVCVGVVRYGFLSLILSVPFDIVSYVCS